MLIVPTSVMAQRPLHTKKNCQNPNAFAKAWSSSLSCLKVNLSVSGEQSRERGDVCVLASATAPGRSDWDGEWALTSRERGDVCVVASPVTTPKQSEWDGDWVSTSTRVGGNKSGNKFLATLQTLGDEVEKCAETCGLVCRGRIGNSAGAGLNVGVETLRLMRFG